MNIKEKYMKFLNNKGVLLKLVITLCIVFLLMNFSITSVVQAKHQDTGSQTTGTFQAHGGVDAEKTEAGKAKGKTKVYKDGCYVDSDGVTHTEEGTTYGQSGSNGYGAGTQDSNYTAPTNGQSDDDAEHSEAMQGGKLLTPIIDLLMTIGDGLMDVMQKAIIGTNGHVTLDIEESIWSVVLGIAAAVLVIVVISVLTAGIGTFIAGIGGVLGTVLTAVSTSTIVSTIVTGFTIGLAGLTYVSVTAFAGGNLPDITVIPTFSVSPEEIFEGRLLIFDVNFFNPKDLWVETKSGTKKLAQNYNSKTDGEVENYYWVDDSGEEVKTSKQNTSAELSVTISKWYYAIRNLAVVIMMLMLVYIGIRMMLCSIASEKSKYKKMLVDWLVSMCLVFILHYIMVFAVNVNEEIVKLVSASIDGNQQVVVVDLNNMDKGKRDKFVEGIEKHDDMKIYLYDSNNNPVYSAEDGSKTGGDAVSFMWPTNLVGKLRMIEQMQNGSSEYVGYAIAYLVLVFYTIFFAFTYIKRVIYLAFLTVIAPLVAMTYSIDKISDGKAQAFNMWIKEYIGNLLIQPVHLLLYMLLISMSFDLASENIIYTLVAIGFMMPAEKLIRSMFGLDKAKTPGFLGGAVGAGITMNALGKLDRFSKGHKLPEGKERPPKLAKKEDDKSGKIKAEDGKGISDRMGIDSGGNGEDTTVAEDTAVAAGAVAGATAGKALDENNDSNNKEEDDPVTKMEREGLEEKIADGQLTPEELTPEQRRLLGISDEDKDGEEDEDDKDEKGDEDDKNDKQKTKVKDVPESKMLDESKRIRKYGNIKEPEKPNKYGIMKRAGNAFRQTVGSKSARKNVMIKGVKSAGSKVKLAGSIVGAGVGASIGIAAGVASGDVQNAIKYGGLGAASGKSVLGGLTSSVVDSVGNGVSTYKESKEKIYDKKAYEKYERDKANYEFYNDANNRKFFEEKFKDKLDDCKNEKEKNKLLDEIMEDAVEYRKSGVSDNEVISKAMKLDKKDRRANDSIAAAQMLTKGKDMDGISKYQEALGKKFGKDRTEVIADKARKLGGFI